MSRKLETILSLPAAQCYERFCDVGSLRQWVPGLQSAQAISSHPGTGRPAEVRFTVSAAAASELEYTLLYTYDPTNLRVAWYPGSEAASAVRGYASFYEHAEGCRMVYALELGPARGAAETQVLEEAAATVESFQRWVESAG